MLELKKIPLYLINNELKKIRLYLINNELKKIPLYLIYNECEIFSRWRGLEFLHTE